MVTCSPSGKVPLFQSSADTLYSWRGGGTYSWVSGLTAGCGSPRTSLTCTQHAQSKDGLSVQTCNAC
jgi:hypothetical protein